MLEHVEETRFGNLGLMLGYECAMNGVDGGGEEVLMPAPKVQGETVSTDDKRAYLRQWALGLAGGDHTGLPTIREARAEIRRHMGDAPGAGLGTDVITTLLRGLRDELAHAKGPAGMVGHIEAPSTPGELMEVVNRVAQMMKAAGLTSLTIDTDGFPVEMKRVQK